MTPESRHNAMFVHSKNGIPPTLEKINECVKDIWLHQIEEVLGRKGAVLKANESPDIAKVEYDHKLIANEYGEPAILIHVETEVHPEKYD